MCCVGADLPLEVCAMAKQNRRSDPIYLVFEPDPDFVKPTKLRPEGVTVDLVADTWSYNGSTFKIGEANEAAYQDGWPIIGVYDRNNDHHLDEMVFVACSNARRNPEVRGR
jgi:hypothetical protein